jgi:hypothetical protein
MRKTILAIVALGFLTVIVAPALAHHSFAAQYDSNKPVTLKGAVTKVEWQNPHTYFYIDVKDVKIGDEIIVEGSLAKDGSNLANARRVKLASTGQVLGAGSSGGDYQ